MNARGRLTCHQVENGHLRFVAVTPLAPREVSLYPQVPLLAQLASEAGWESTLLVSAPERIKEIVPGVRVQQNGFLGRRRYPRIIRVCDRLATVLRIVALRPEVILASEASIVDAIVAGRTLMRLGHGCIVLAHFADYNEPNKGWWLRYVVRHAKELGAIVEVEPTRLNLRRRWMKVPDHAFVILNAVRRRLRPPVLMTGARVLRLVFTGRPHEKIRPDSLCESIARCSAQEASITWLYPGDDGERQALNERWNGAVRRGVLRLLPALPRSALVDALEEYDLGIVWNPVTGHDPQTYIQFDTCASNKVGEYIAAGLGVIYTGNSGLAFLRSSGSGMEVNPDDPDSLAQLCRFLVLRPALVDQMRERAQGLHEQMLNLEVQAAPLFAWLSKTVPFPTA